MAERASKLRPVQERVQAHTRRQACETYLSTRGYVLFPGQYWDLTDETERAQALEWLVGLLEELGAST